MDYTYGYGNYNLPSNFNTLGGFWATVAALAGIIIVICLIVFVLDVLGRWKMFEKAGENGWKAIIPFYNEYIQCKLTGVNVVWFWIILAGLLISWVPVLNIIYTIVTVYYRVLLCVSTAKSYNQDPAFGVGIFFLPQIFYLILGLGSAKYVGVTPMEDPVMNAFIGKKDTTKEAEVVEDATTKDTKDAKYCPECGTKIAKDTKYCPKCGKKL
jgi:hypothetical protein